MSRKGIHESYCKNMITGSLHVGTSVDDVTKDIIPKAAAALANQVQQVLKILAFLLLM
jgi:hypothetical protein